MVAGCQRAWRRPKPCHAERLELLILACPAKRERWDASTRTPPRAKLPAFVLGLSRSTRPKSRQRTAQVKGSRCGQTALSLGGRQVRSQPAAFHVPWLRSRRTVVRVIGGRYTRIDLAHSRPQRMTMAKEALSRSELSGGHRASRPLPGSRQRRAVGYSSPSAKCCPAVDPGGASPPAA